MRLRSSFRLPLAGLLLLAAVLPLRAGAQESEGPRLAVPVSGRGMAIGRLNLMLGAEPGVVFTGGVNVYRVILPLRFGITEDLELFAGPVAQTVDPSFHDPALGVLYRLLDGPLELGVRAAADLSLFGTEKYAAVQLGVPLRLRILSIVAADLGANALLSFIPQNAVGFLVPAGVTVNLGDHVFAGVAAAARLQSFSDWGTLTLPASAMLGFTISGNERPFFDLAARMAWDDLQVTGVYSVGASVRLYLYP